MALPRPVRHLQRGNAREHPDGTQDARRLELPARGRVAVVTERSTRGGRRADAARSVCPGLPCRSSAGEVLVSGDEPSSESGRERTGSTPAQADGGLLDRQPAVQLVTALNWTEEILRGERMGGRYPNKQGPGIEAALASRYPVKVSPGRRSTPSTGPCRATPTALVLDRWAAFAAGHDRSKDIPRAVRRELESAYRAAAAACR